MSSNEPTAGATRLRRTIADLRPAMGRFALREQARAGAVAACGLAGCVILGLIALDSGHALLFAPLGASAVLLFAVPNSPLAQPWSAVAGNTASAILAIAVTGIVPSPWAAPVCVGGAIVLMMGLRALHPPGGAVALLVALGAADGHPFGQIFALLPVALGTGALVAFAIGLNRLTGRVYPFRRAASQRDGAAARHAGLGLSTEELRALLSRFNQSTNLGAADLGRLLAAAEMEAARHRFDGRRCGDVMTRPLVTVGSDASLDEVAARFRAHPIESLPVTDAAGRMLGLILKDDLLDWAVAGPDGRSWRRADGRRTAPRAEAVMRTDVRAVPHDTPVGVLLGALGRNPTPVVPVTEGETLVGVITRADVLDLLLEGAGQRVPA